MDLKHCTEKDRDIKRQHIKGLHIKRLRYRRTTSQMDKLKEISPVAWLHKEYQNYIPLDIRDEAEYELGHIENAKWMAISDLLKEPIPLTKEKPYLLYCKYGTISRELGERLHEKGYTVANLYGGYGAYVLEKIKLSSKI